MSKRAIRPQSRRHILVYDEDWKWLETAFGASSPGRLGVGPIIRQIVHLYVGRLRSKTQIEIDTFVSSAREGQDL